MTLELFPPSNVWALKAFILLKVANNAVSCSVGQLFRAIKLLHIHCMVKDLKTVQHVK